MLEYECDYVIVSVPLPIVEYFEFEPALSLKKQEAIRSTKCIKMTKVCLEFREQFWSVDVERGNEFDRPPLPDDKRIDGGISVSTDVCSQIVYPTPPNYHFDGDQPFMDWNHCDTPHPDDGSKAGILISYSSGKKVE